MLVATPESQVPVVLPQSTPRFNGAPTKCKGFLIAYVHRTTDHAVSHRGKQDHLHVLAAYGEGDGLGHGGLGQPRTKTIQLREVFKHSEGGRSAGEQLLVLRQERQMATEYARSFCTLAVQTGVGGGHPKTTVLPGIKHQCAIRAGLL